MTDEIEVLLKMARDVYRTLGANGYYDGELSLDNLGFVIERSKVRVVLTDLGGIVNTRHISPSSLGPWLETVEKNYTRSYQAYKLRTNLGSTASAATVVEHHIQDILELIRTWTLQNEIKQQKQSLKCS
jgi:hypothetical protein